MKFIKFSIIALVLTVSAQFAKAQVRVGATIHIGYQPRTVVYPAYYEEPAPVYYEQPVYVNRVYYRPGYRRAYYRPQYRRVVYREHYYEGRGHGRGHGNGWGRGGRRW
jgi:hypothetical protein